MNAHSQEFNLEQQTSNPIVNGMNLDSARNETYGAEASFKLAQGDSPQTQKVLGAGFELFDSNEPVVIHASVNQESISAQDKEPDYEKLADRIEEAANGGWTGLGTDVDELRDVLSPLNEEEYNKVNEIFTRKHGVKYADKGESWTIMDELKDELNEGDLAQFKNIIEVKSKNEVPEEFRVTGESLLKEGSELQVGETNRIELKDGRSYDVYVPRNADKRAPVIVAMHGAGMGDMKGVMEDESGLTMDAEQLGAIVVFATPKVQEFQTQGWVGWFGNQNGVAWNVPGEGRQDLPKAESDDYNDQDYIDAVKADLDNRMQTSEKIGMFGFSDGGRFAQTYAADRPDNVAAVASMHGTWMEGDSLPEESMPMLIVHSDADETLKYEGGMGSMGETMDGALGTNLDKSRPAMQKEVWRKVNGCDGTVNESEENGLVTREFEGCSNAPVTEHIVKGAAHGIHDIDNNGSRVFQWLLGEPDRNQDLATTSARFLKKHILGDS